MEFIKTAGIPVDPGHNSMWRLHTTNNLGMMECKMHHNKIVNYFLSIIFNTCIRGSKEPSHQDGSFEYPQHMFWLRKKKINLYSYLKA